MLIDKKVIENCKEAVGYLKKNKEESAFFETDWENGVQIIGYMVTWQNQMGDDIYTYWNKGVEGFCFGGDFLELADKIEED